MFVKTYWSHVLKYAEIQTQTMQMIMYWIWKKNLSPAFVYGSFQKHFSKNSSESAVSLRGQKFRHIQISLPINLKKSCVKRPTCFFQQMSDQTNLWCQKSKEKSKGVFSTFVLIYSSKTR